MKKCAISAVMLGAAFAVSLCTTPSWAAPNEVYVDPNAGVDTNNTTCAVAAPCKSLQHAHGVVADPGTIVVLSSGVFSPTFTISKGVTILCPHVSCVLDGSDGAQIFVIFATGKTVTVDGLTVDGFGTASSPGIDVRDVGKLVLRNVNVTNVPIGLDFEPFSSNAHLEISDSEFSNASGQNILFSSENPMTAVLTRTRLYHGGTGIMTQSCVCVLNGGIIKVTLDHVVITASIGGGIRTSTNTPAILDITDSVITENGGNGINVLAGALQNIVSVKNSIIARNGGAGVQANGANAGVLLANTLLDQNSVGATSVVSGGNIFTYGNNQIVGPIGSGFTATAPLQ